MNTSLHFANLWVLKESGVGISEMQVINVMYFINYHNHRSFTVQFYLKFAPQY